MGIIDDWVGHQRGFDPQQGSHAHSHCSPWCDVGTGLQDWVVIYSFCLMIYSWSGRDWPMTTTRNERKRVKHQRQFGQFALRVQCTARVSYAGIE